MGELAILKWQSMVNLHNSVIAHIEKAKFINFKKSITHIRQIKNEIL